ncbi:MAG TPA: ATP-dependent DNA helicase RecG [Candidatus Eisenbacteria bacterium]|nr:ATP-dependent DNA helicase RecG [Candidatus Eisenbacteria bacterium]
MGTRRPATAPATAAARRAQPAPALRLDSPVSVLPRIRATEVRLLRKLGLHTVRDLLLHLPFGWEAYGGPTPIADLPANGQATVVATVVRIAPKRSRFKGRELVEAEVADDEGTRMRVAWFNRPYLVRELRPGDRLVLAGKVSLSRYGRQMQHPQYEREEGAAAARWLRGLLPKYHSTGGLTSRRLATLVESALPLAGELEDDIPEPARARHRLMPLAEAVRRGHQPESEPEWREARRRMEFGALLELQAAFLVARRRIGTERATPIPYRQDVIDAFKAGLGFELTRAQRRATWDVYQDMGRPVPMNRLLNGDVGSGKTAVAAAAAAMAHAAGLQTVMMAPTEILARQHRDKLRAYLEQSFPDLKVELLVSGLPAAERRRVRTAAASGHCALLVGTHALIEDDVELAGLGLAVVDEQHRFGTRQRELLREKSRGGRPHFLAMTATPIPRSLALALYGEMALSMIDELPPGRTPVETRVVPPGAREEAYELVRREVRAGRQVFVICPLIEESEKLETKAATVEFERLRREVFPDLRLGLVHGRMKGKDEAMRGFRAGESDVLVATSVVEVGVDVPNATVMMIEGADRFGLAQLHQLRGRVGRGARRSYCLLLSEDPSSTALQRLHLVADTSDGFHLAREDMRLRGVGELMGARQHGMTDYAMRVLQQPELLSEVRQEAESLLAADPDLTRWPALWLAAARRLDQTSIS